MSISETLGLTKRGTSLVISTLPVTPSDPSSNDDALPSRHATSVRGLRHNPNHRTVNALTNQELFSLNQSGCPSADQDRHLAGLGLHRLDYEATQTAGDVLFRIEESVEQGIPENKITTLPYLLKRFGNRDDVAAFLSALHDITGEDTDQQSQQTVASHYLREMATRPRNEVLKEMALLGFQMKGINAERDEEEEQVIVLESIERRRPMKPEKLQTRAPKPQFFPIFTHELQATERMIYRKSSGSFNLHPDRDFQEEWEGLGLTEEESGEVLEAMEQYDENGLIHMSSYHRPTTVGTMSETDYDKFSLPEEHQPLINLVTKAYIYSQDNPEFWTQLRTHLDDERMFEILQQIHAGFGNDLHLRLMRNVGLYRGIYTRLRKAKDMKEVSGILKEAFQAKEKQFLSLQAFTLISTAGKLHQERLRNERDYPLTFLLKRAIKENPGIIPSLNNADQEAYKLLKSLPTQQQTRVWEAVPEQPATKYLIRKINESRLPQLKSESWRMYPGNDPDHIVHKLPPPQAQQVWNLLKERRAALAAA
ncbi:MAG: hypothetical protein JST84_04630 [Acidobacteria bacterium]|nr:hypothetical protein [Acidobacteriota bacterium]